MEEPTYVDDNGLEVNHDGIRIDTEGQVIQDPESGEGMQGFFEDGEPHWIADERKELEQENEDQDLEDLKKGLRPVPEELMDKIITEEDKDIDSTDSLESIVEVLISEMKIMKAEIKVNQVEIDNLEKRIQRLRRKGSARV